MAGHCVFFFFFATDVKNFEEKKKDKSTFYLTYYTTRCDIRRVVLDARSGSRIYAD